MFVFAAPSAAIAASAAAREASSSEAFSPAQRDYGGPTEVATTSTAEVTPREDDLSELDALRRRVDQLERRDAERRDAEREREREHERNAKPAVPMPSHQPLAPGPGRNGEEIGFGRLVAPSEYGLRLSGYVQAQYLHNQLSEDQYLQGGMPLNRDGFAVRRGRLRVAGDWRFAAFALELDGSTTRGPFVGVRQAHVSALYRNPDAKRPPYIMVTAGLTEVPFGYEVRLSQRDMMFMERTTGSLALFPGPVDLGLRLRGGLGPFRYDLAVMNGSPLADVAGGAGIDPTRKPDVAGRVGIDVKPRKISIAGGLSFLAGKGLHTGQDATKNHLEWIDLNENGSIDSAEIFAVPGTAALPSVGFSRWAVNADLQVGFRTKIGATQLWAEVTIAENLDRGLFVADPFATGADLRHLQAYGGVLQDLTRWGVLGFRYDFYDYNSDLLTRSRGLAVPADASIHTLSPLVGAVLPTGVVPRIRGRLMLQYDIVLDALGRDRRGVPTNVANDQVTVRVQVEF